MPESSSSVGHDALVSTARLGLALADATGDNRWRDVDMVLLTGGKSNLTFELRSPAGELILRRPPAGSYVPGAHDLSREVRVQRALADTAIPVPRIVLAEPSSDLMGAPFYVMDKVHGYVLCDDLPVGYAHTSDERRRIADVLVDTLAQIHAIDPAKVGLADFGRPEGFLARQLARWTAQSDVSAHAAPALRALGTALHARLPDRCGSCLVHGDFRLDNCVLDAGDPGRIAGVLDWEMSTLGDPLLDLGLLLHYWAEPGEAVASLAPKVTMLQGFPDRAYLRERYARQTGRDLTNIGFYEAFARFKFAVIIQGVAARCAEGAMAGQDFGPVDEDVTRLAESGLAILEGKPDSARAAM